MNVACAAPYAASDRKGAAYDAAPDTAQFLRNCMVCSRSGWCDAHHAARTAWWGMVGQASVDVILKQHGECISG